MKKRIALKKPYHLWWVAGINGSLMFLIALFRPKWIGYAMLLLVGVTFRLAYSVPVKNRIWFDLRVFIAGLMESSLSSGLFILTCIFSQKACEPNELRAQIFINYSIPLIMISMFWLSMRLPVLIKRTKR